MTAAADRLRQLASGSMIDRRPLLEIGAALISTGPSLGRGVPGACPAGRRMDPDAWPRKHVAVEVCQGSWKVIKVLSFDSDSKPFKPLDLKP